VSIFGLILTVILGLEADFVQTKSSAMFSEPQVATGHMTYRAPDFMQWEYRTPQPVVWMIDGNQSNVNPQIQKLLRMIMSSVAGGSQDDPNLQREAKRLFRSVNVTMDESGEVAQRVELIEKNGDTTLIEFSHVVTQ